MCNLACVQWDLPLLLSRCDALYETLDPSIRLIPSRPQNLLQRKKTLACNLAFSVCPYIDVNGKKERFEFNRLFGAARNGPDRLTEQFVPDSVKAHVQVRGCAWMRMRGPSLGGAPLCSFLSCPLLTRLLCACFFLCL